MTLTYSLRGLSPAVHRATTQLVRTLQQHHVPYAISGGVACNLLGHSRATNDVDVLIAPDSLAKLAKALDGRGYLRRYPGALRSWKDTLNHVDIDVLVSGDFPGDGLPKSVSFPKVDTDSPAVVTVRPEESDVDVSTLSLPSLIELKLASAASAPHRLKDAADVQALIEIHDLPLEFTRELNASVRPNFADIWFKVQEARRQGRV